MSGWFWLNPPTPGPKPRGPERGSGRGPEGVARLWGKLLSDAIQKLQHRRALCDWVGVAGCFFLTGVLRCQDWSSDGSGLEF